jgi:hypothetical protein
VYRHGFLLSPAVVEQALAWIADRYRPSRWRCLNGPLREEALACL